MTLVELSGVWLLEKFPHSLHSVSVIMSYDLMKVCHMIYIY